MPDLTSSLDLPFLLNHAAWIRWIVLVVSGGIGVGVIALVRRWLAAREASAAVKWVSALEPETLVRGILRGEGADPVLATLRATRRGVSLRSSWAAPAWIETPDGRVELDSDVLVLVLAGDRAYAARRGIPRQAPAEVEAHARKEYPSLSRARLRDRLVWTSHLVMLSPGTRVVASGEIITPTAGEDGGRDVAAASTRRLTGYVRIAAVTPRSAPRPLPIQVTLALFAASALLTYAIIDHHEDELMEACSGAQPDPERYVALPETHACAIAAALTGDEARAVEALTGVLEDHAYRDQRSFDRVTALLARTEGCPAVLTRLWKHDRLDDVVVWARACGDRRREHDALVVQGRFAEAVGVPVEGTDEFVARPTRRTLIMAGAFAEAATQVDVLRTRLHVDGAEDPDARASQDRELACVGELLRHHGGDLAAGERLRALAHRDQDPSCLAAASETLPEAEGAALLASTSGHSSVLAALRWSRGGEVPLQSGVEEMLARSDAQREQLYFAWLAPSAVSATAPGSLERAHALRWQTLAHVLDGDLDAATRTAREVASLAAAAWQVHHAAPPPVKVTTTLYELREASLLPAAVALRSTSNDFPLPLDEVLDADAFEQRSRQVERRHDHYSLALARLGDTTGLYNQLSYSDALDAAVQGGGRELAAQLSSDSWIDDLELLAVLPRITSSRAALLRNLMWGRYSRNWDGFAVWDEVWRVSLRRDLFRVAGLPEEAARWDAYYQRFDAALSDRRILIPLLFLDL